MLLVHRDIAGRLLAALDYQIVNRQGQVDPYGTAVWVEQLEVAAREDAVAHIRRFIQEIADLQPLVQGAYWERRDRPGRPRLWFSRTQLVTFGRRDEDAVRTHVLS